MARPVPNLSMQNLQLTQSRHITFLFVLIGVFSVFSVVTYLCASYKANKSSRKQKEETELISQSSDQKKLLSKLNSNMSNKAHSMVKMISWRKVQDEDEGRNHHKTKKPSKKQEEQTALTPQSSDQKKLLSKLNSSMSNKAHSMVKMISWRKAQDEDEGRSHHKTEKSSKKQKEETTLTSQSSDQKKLLSKLNSNISNKAHLIVKMISWRKVQDEDEGEDEDEAVWKRSIIMGERCRPLDFSGKILYDAEGNLLPDSDSSTKIGVNQ